MQYVRVEWNERAELTEAEAGSAIFPTKPEKPFWKGYIGKKQGYIRKKLIALYMSDRQRDRRDRWKNCVCV